MNEVFHIDFFGVPGSGKSTISHALAISLRKKGFRVKEPSYHLDHSRTTTTRKLIKAALFAYYFFFQHRTLRAVDFLVRQNGYSGKPRLLHIGNILQKLFEYDKRNNGYDFCIWDQGIAQACISLSMTRRLDATANLNYIIKLLPKSIQRQYVFVDVALSIVLERLNQKRKLQSRIELIRDEAEMKKALLAFADDCISIQTVVNPITISGNSPLEEDLLLNTIKLQ